jgi:manganese efflux pump family protein
MKMNMIIEILLISIGLAMDAFAVSITSGITIQKMKLGHAFMISAFFGFFQALMPLLGWALGFSFRTYIQSVDHWIAFILLGFIGTKMIIDSRSDEKDDSFNPLNVYILFTLSIATSIDALAVGITFSFLDIQIWYTSTIIGLITFVICLIGTKIGKTYRHLLEDKVEVFGGLILIAIGIKILVQHLFFS